MAAAIAVAILALTRPVSRRTVALAFGLCFLYFPVLMGIFSKSINKEGAIAGMIAGISVTLFYVFHKGILFIADWKIAKLRQ